MWHSTLQEPRSLRALGLAMVHVRASSHQRHLDAHDPFRPPQLGGPSANTFMEDITVPTPQRARQPEPAFASSAACFALNASSACLLAFAKRAYDWSSAGLENLGPCHGVHLHVYIGMYLCLHTYLHPSIHPASHPPVRATYTQTST